MKTYELLVNAPKTKRGQETLDKICSSAEQLFYEKGYHNTSINDITSLASVAAGTFYIYFDEKLSIYKYLLLQYSHEIRKYLSSAVAGAKDRYEAEYRGILHWLIFLKDHKHIFNIIWESLYIDRSLYVDYYENFSKAYSQQLQEARDKGEVGDINVEVSSYVMMGITNFVGLKYVLFDEVADYEAVAKEVMKILEGGMFGNR